MEGGQHLKFLSTTPNHFSAILKTPDDKIIEYGIAWISVEDQSINFKSEFVPICEMGTPLKIVRVQDELETQAFTGEVYLSSQHLLRLISLSDEVLPAASSVFLYDVKIEGSAEATIEAPDKPTKLFSLRTKYPAALALQIFPVSIYAISLAKVRFTCDMMLSKGQRVTLNVKQPIALCELPLEVVLPITLGTGDTCSYHCKILELSGNNAFQLESYVDRLSQQKNKLFPPVVTSSEATDS